MVDVLSVFTPNRRAAEKERRWSRWKDLDQIVEQRTDGEMTRGGKREHGGGRGWN